MKKQYKQALAAALAAALAWNLMPNIPYVMAETSADYVIEAVEPLDEEILYQQVEFGTEKEALALPDTLRMLVRTGDRADADVSDGENMDNGGNTEAGGEDSGKVSTPSNAELPDEITGESDPGEPDEAAGEPAPGEPDKAAGEPAPGQSDEIAGEPEADEAWQAVRVDWVLDAGSSGAENYDGGQPGLYVFDAEPVNERYVVGDAELPRIQVEVLEEKTPAGAPAGGTAFRSQRRILSWQWVDPEDYLAEAEDGSFVLMLTASAETPAGLGEVLELLPAQIVAETVYGRDGLSGEETGDKEVGDEETGEPDAETGIGTGADSESNAEAGSDTGADGENEGSISERISLNGWSCADFPEDGAYEGEYTFTAALPDGYVLDAEAAEPAVQVRFGGAWLPVTLQLQNNAASVRLGESGEETLYASFEAAWEAAKNHAEGAAITLLSDADITDALLVESGDNITLRSADGMDYTLSGSFSGTANGVIRILDGTFTIESGTVKNLEESGGAAIFMEGGRLNATGGTLSGAGNGIRMNGDAAEAMIFGGSAVLASKPSSNAVYCKDGTLWVYEGAYIRGVDTGISIYGSGRVVIRGGTILAENPEDPENPMNSTAGVRLYQNSTAEITGGDISGGMCGLWVGYDSPGTAAVIRGGNFRASVAHGLYVRDGVVEVYGGSFQGTDTGIMVQNGDCTISDAEVSGKNGLCVYKDSTGTAVLRGGTYTGTENAILISREGLSVGDILADGYSWYEDGGGILADASVSALTGTFEVRETSAASVSAGGETEYFASIEEAWARAKEQSSSEQPATITLLQDVQVNERLTVENSNSIILTSAPCGEETEGYGIYGNVSVRDSGLIDVQGGSLTLTGGIVENGDGGNNGVAVNGGSFLLDGGTVRASADGHSGVCVYSGTAEIRSGTVSGDIGVAAANGSAVIMIEDGDIYGRATGVYVSGSEASAVIRGGRISASNTQSANGSDGSALQVQASGTAVLSGGTYDGAVGIAIHNSNPLTLKGLLDEDLNSVYYKDGEPVADGLDGRSLAGTISVGECTHRYGNTWTDKEDGKTHGRACEVCGHEETENHQWGDDGSCTAEGCTAVVSYVASVTVGGVTTYYTEFDAAWQAATAVERAEVMVLKSVDLKAARFKVPAGTDIILDMADEVILSKTIGYGGQGSCVFRICGGKFTFAGGTIDNTVMRSYGIEVESGSFIMEAGIIRAHCCGVYVSNGDMTMTGGTISVTKDDIVTGYGIHVYGSNSRVLMEGGEISVSGTYNDRGMYVQQGTVSISGNSVIRCSGLSGLYYCNGSLELSGGTFIGGTYSICTDGSSISSLLAQDCQYYVETNGGIQTKISDEGILGGSSFARKNGYGTVVVKREETVNVSVEWGELSFSYSRGAWDPETHTYRGAGWRPAGAGSDTAGGNDAADAGLAETGSDAGEYTDVNRILVTNEGTAAVAASFGFLREESLTQAGDLAGSFWRKGQTEAGEDADSFLMLDGAAVVLNPGGDESGNGDAAGDTAEVWLRLSSGEPTDSIDGTLGAVTVTIEAVSDGGTEGGDGA